MQRRAFLKVPFLAAAARYTYAVRALPDLKITGVKAIPTSAGGGYRWGFLKVLTSEPGLYGIGSASNVFQTAPVVAAIEQQYAPFWIGKNPARIEDLWQSTNVTAYWRNSTIQNNVLSGLDMALWDITGKRAGMPVYELLGGKVRDAIPLYAHADGRDPDEVVENVHKFMEEGYRHVRAQMGGYLKERADNCALGEDELKRRLRTHLIPYAKLAVGYSSMSDDERRGHVK